MPDSVSYWYWYIILFLVCFLLLLIPFPADDQQDLYTFVASFVVLLTGFPLLGICLFADASKVSMSDIDWNPNPLLYGIPALAQYSLFTDRWIPEMIPSELLFFGPSVVSVIYLIQRFRYVGLPLRRYWVDFQTNYEK